jgi:hypothetical protein
LLGRCDRHRAGTAALSPRAFEDDAISPICIARLELDGFLAPQTECLIPYDARSNSQVAATPINASRAFRPAPLSQQLKVTSSLIGREFQEQCKTVDPDHHLAC